MLGTQDLLIGLVLAAFFFGAKRLPEIARSLGQSMTEFKKAVSDASTPAAARTCLACKTALERDWAHCPRCGTTITSSTPPTSGAR